MKKNKIYTTQIISILKQQEVGISVKDVICEYGISEGVFLNIFDVQFSLL